MTDALVGVWGAGRVSVRLSPNGDSQGVDDSNPEPLFTAAATGLAVWFIKRPFRHEETPA